MKLTDEIRSRVYGGYRGPANFVFKQGDARNSWPVDDVDILLKLRSEGLTYKQIAIKMGRTWKQVTSKLERLKLPPRTTGL